MSSTPSSPTLTPLVTPPTSSQLSTMMEDVMKVAQTIEPAVPKGDSVLAVFMPAYTKAKGDVIKGGKARATSQNSGIHFYASL